MMLMIAGTTIQMYLKCSLVPEASLYILSIFLIL